MPLIPEAALHRNHPCEACPHGNGEQGSTASYYAAPRIHHRPTVVVMPANAVIQRVAGVAVSLSNHTAGTTHPKDGFLLSQEWLPLIPEAALHRNHPCESRGLPPHPERNARGGPRELWHRLCADPFRLCSGRPRRPARRCPASGIPASVPAPRRPPLRRPPWRARASSGT